MMPLKPGIAFQPLYRLNVDRLMSHVCFGKCRTLQGRCIQNRIRIVRAFDISAS